jgi:hypothetical protein
VHRGNLVELCQARMGDLAFHKSRRDDPDHGAARGESGIGNGTHEPDSRAA